jgi:hypothetical protein
VFRPLRKRIAWTGLEDEDSHSSAHECGAQDGTSGAAPDDADIHGVSNTHGTSRTDQRAGTFRAPAADLHH